MLGVSTFMSIELTTYQQAILDDLTYLPSIALFMGTGSGKTFTSLFKVKDNGVKHLLVICPARVVEQWQGEIPKILPDYTILKFPKVCNAHSKNILIRDATADHLVIVVSLEIVHNLPNLLKKVNEEWSIIVDESHKIKELGTKRSPVKVTQMVLALGLKTQNKVILTATPTQKENGGYIDYYAQLRFLGYCNMSRKEFEDRYCRVQKIQVQGTPYPISKIIGYKNTEEIDKLLSLVARRYVPKFTDGEPRNIEIPLDKPKSYATLSNERFYKDLHLESLSAMRIAKKTLTSGRVIGYDKFHNPLVYTDNSIKKDWVEDFLKNTDECIIIFYKYNVEREQLKEVCENLHIKYIILDGENNHKKESIESEGYQVIIGQYQACGESIDGLQYKSHIVIYYAMPESSLEYVQSLGRINRYGQVNLPIYYHLVMKKTIDEQIYKMTLKKVEFNESVLDKLTLERGE